MSNNEPSPENAKRAIQALNNLVDGTAVLINQNQVGYSPIEGSQGYIELNTSKRGESISTAFSQGASLIEAAGDHIYALVRSLTEPMLSIAAWSSARSALEACATSTWLLDPRIDSSTRIQRSLAFRYDNLNEQAKIARLLKDSASEKRIIQRINDVEQIALGLGFNKVLNTKGQRFGIGIEMPGPTKLIGEMLNEEYTYRILSGIAHGQSWALQNLSFRLRPDYGRILKTENIPIGARLVERNLEPSHIIYFCRILAKVFAKTIYFSLILFGWNEERLMEIVKEQFSEIGIKDYDMKSLIT